MAKVRIQRSKQLSDKLKALRVETQKPVRAALADVATDIVGMMTRLVPDGPGKGAYDLGQSIKWNFGADEGGGSDANSGRSAATRVVITAGDKLNPEAKWVEFGTPPRINAGIYAGTQHPGTPPQPFFFPSYRAHKKAAKTKIGRAVVKAVKEVAKR
jgi:hypothetical protein